MKQTKLIILFLLFSAFCKADDGLILFYQFNNTDVSAIITDESPVQNHGKLHGKGAEISDGVLTLPGGSYNSAAAYVELPVGMFDNKDTLSISVWLKNETGSANYSAMFFGTTESMPHQYWLLNPANPSGRLKSVITNFLNTGAPYNSEYGISPSVAAQGITGPITDSEWHLYTTVITPTTLTAYYDDQSIGTVNINRKVSDFGADLVAYIGKSSYADIFYSGSVKRVMVYEKAFSHNDVKKEYFNTLIEEDLKNVQPDSLVLGDITLPVIGKNGSSVRWASSDIAYITERGKVTRHNADDKKVILIATATLNDYSVIKTYLVRVYADNAEKNLAYYADNLDLGITYITENIELPQIENGDVSITWTSSNNTILNSNGEVNRPAIGSGDQQIVLTAKIESQGQFVEKGFQVTVAEADYGYLISYILSGGTELTNAFHIAKSLDGNSYEKLNNGKAILYPLTGSKKLHSPHIFRKPDGSFGVIASDNSDSGVILFDSPDLVEYENEKLLKLNNQGIGVLSPVCKYNNLSRTYSIKWQGSDGEYYESTTKDFNKIISTTKISAYTLLDVSGAFPENAIDINRIALTQNEYNKVVRKYGKITNTGIAPLAAVTVSRGQQVELPQRVTAQYSDGSSKTLGVVWNADDINAIDVNNAGTYTVNGIVQQPDYSAPFIRERADPWITLGDDGYYYFTASYPMVGSNDPEGYDRVILRRATTIEGLVQTEEITIWDESNCSSCYRYVWAPEIHQINGTWFVFFTTSTSGNVWNIRPRIISCTLDEKNPFNPACWETVGHLMEPFTGDNVSFTNFSLDMTHFENNGKHYVVWAQTMENSSLAIAAVDANEPWKTTSEYMLLTAPEYAWELQDAKVNEGAAVIKNNGKIYIAFSAAAVNENYCVGLLYADEDADLLDINSWTKVKYPLLATDDLPANQSGPGHNSFTIDQYGNPVIAYHARNPQEITDGGLYDPGRHAFVKSVNFAFDGTPVLNMTKTQELDPQNRNVSLQIEIE